MTLNRSNAILVNDFVRNKSDRQLFIVRVILTELLHYFNESMMATQRCTVEVEPNTTCDTNVDEAAVSEGIESEANTSIVRCNTRSRTETEKGKEHEKGIEEGRQRKE